MTEEERGKQIIESVHKAALAALLSIGVKSIHYVDSFNQYFARALDQEFFRIGLFQPKQEARETSELGDGPSAPKTRDISKPLDELQLHPLIQHALNKAGIATIEQLMTTMQQKSLTDIKGIKEKSARQILEKLKLWNS